MISKFKIFQVKIIISRFKFEIFLVICFMADGENLGENIVFSKRGYQSSTHTTSLHTLYASRAVDDIIEISHTTGEEFQCSATGTFDPNPWISFDLENVYLIKTVKVLSRSGDLGNLISTICDLKFIL